MRSAHIVLRNLRSRNDNFERPQCGSSYLKIPEYRATSASATMRFVSGWRPREWCMAPSGGFITFSQLSVGLAVWRCGLFRLR